MILKRLQLTYKKETILEVSSVFFEIIYDEFGMLKTYEGSVQQRLRFLIWNLGKV